MQISAALGFLESNHRGVLATRRRDGRPQLSPVVAATDRDGAVVVSTRTQAMKARNVRRDPAVSLCVMGDGFFGDWVQLDGTASVLALPEAMDGLVEYYRAVAGEHPDWDEYRRVMRDEARVLLRITVTHAGPDRAG